MIMNWNLRAIAKRDLVRSFVPIVGEVGCVVVVVCVVYIWLVRSFLQKYLALYL